MLYIVLAFVAGVIVGAFGHSYIQPKSGGGPGEEKSGGGPGEEK